MITKDTLEELENTLDIRKMIVYGNKDTSKDYLKGIQYTLDVLRSIYNRDMRDSKTDTVSIKESYSDTVPNKDSSITDNPSTDNNNNHIWNWISRLN